MDKTYWYRLPEPADHQPLAYLNPMHQFVGYQIKAMETSMFGNLCIITEGYQAILSIQKKKHPSHFYTLFY